MKYCLDTNAVIAICRSEEALSGFSDYLQQHLEDTFFIPSYVNDEYIEGEPDSAYYSRLIKYAKVEVGIDHFFTIGVSILGGSDILASGSSGYSQIPYTVEDYKQSGSKKDYWTWRKRKINDRLITEMAESRLCDAIITENLNDFSKIPQTYDINIVSVSSFIK